MTDSPFLDPAKLPAGKPQGQQAPLDAKASIQTALNQETTQEPAQESTTSSAESQSPNPHGLAGKVTNNHAGQNEKTHFGFEQVSLEAKQDKVAGVFHSVAAKYDLMNDLMSMGIHRLWKRFAISLSGVRSGQSVLDIAGGTGDLALAFSRVVGDSGRVVLSDINSSMLQVGKERLINAGCDNVEVVLANAEDLEPFEDESFDLVTISFGLRNVTDKDAALRSMHRVLKPGGRLLILEFSKPSFEPLSKVYDLYSFTALPMLGKLFAGDSESYRYLAESIRMHPDQNTLKNMMTTAGFVGSEFHNLTGGITALHRGFKAPASAAQEPAKGFAP